MRRAEKAMKDPAAVEEFLRTAPAGRLATVGEDGYPMVKPVNFVFADRAVFFHSAKQGEKMDHLRRDGRVCFEVDLPIAYVKAGEETCRAGYLFRSVILKGRAQILEDPGEKMRALGLLMEKYQGPGHYPLAPDRVEATAVVRIDVESATGKEALGTGRIREDVIRILADGSALPSAIDPNG